MRRHLSVHVCSCLHFDEKAAGRRARWAALNASSSSNGHSPPRFSSASRLTCASTPAACSPPITLRSNQPVSGARASACLRCLHFDEKACVALSVSLACISLRVSLLVYNVHATRAVFSAK